MLLDKKELDENELDKSELRRSVLDEMLLTRIECISNSKITNRCMFLHIF